MNYDFLIVNDVQQYLDPKIFGGGPWMHLATIKTPTRSFKNKTYPSQEFICFKHTPTDKVYIEEVDTSHKGVFKKIEDDELWKDLAQYLSSKGYLAFVGNKEYKIVSPKK